MSKHIINGRLYCGRTDDRLKTCGTEGETGGYLIQCMECRGEGFLLGVTWQPSTTDHEGYPLTGYNRIERPADVVFRKHNGAQCGYTDKPAAGAPVEPLHPHNDGLDEYRQPVHVGELDPAQRLALARGELK